MTRPHSRERAIDRARKLLALAEARGSDEQESQLAFARACEIMQRHDLTEAVVRASRNQTQDPIMIWEYQVTGAGGHGKARAYAAGAIAEAYGAEVGYRNNTTDNRPRQVLIVAAQSDIDALRMLLPMISARAEHAATVATRAHLTDQGWLTPAERRREANRYRRSYLNAFGHGVADKIRNRRRQVVADLLADGPASSSGTELVLAQRQSRVTAEFTRRFPKLRKARRDRSFSREGWAQGRTDGRDAPLGDRSIDTPAPRALPGQ